MITLNKLIFLLLRCLPLLTGLCCLGNVNEDLVGYYENLIQTETQNSYLYDLPRSSHRFQPYSSSYPQVYGTYDFIVVGSGSAGAVLASRLSEIEHWKVLLLEAGGYETPFSEIPGMHMNLQGLRFNWNYNTTRQSTSCLGMINQRCSIPRGMVLGGSSSINGLVYSRGNKEDYNRWARAGNEGWSYEEVLPYFIKSENSQIDGDPGYHGQGGYWNVEYHRPISPQIYSLIEANRQLFGSTGVDYNGREQLGMFVSQLSNLYGRRHSTSKAFLGPASHRRNLEISTNSYVTRVLIDSQKRAYGVEFAKDQILYYATVNKEVIVSGGGINSPQILMLSGIGPEDHLRELGIPVVQNLPVGLHFQDHPAFFGLYVNTNLYEPLPTLRTNIQQYLNAYGPLAIALNSQAVGFYQSTFMDVPGYPDYEFEIQPSNSTNSFLQRSLKLTDETYQALLPFVDPQRAFNPYIILLQPKSYGTLRLKSSDPYEYPLVDTNSLSDPEGIDIEVMYQGLQTLMALLETDAMKRINATLVYGDYPQCRGFLLGSRDYWYCAFRLLTAHLYHPMSGCRMGPDHRTAVVDNTLKVHGIDGLRVVDASILPFPVSGHTSAPIVMIGEKTSDYIKNHYGERVDPINNVL